MPALPTPGHRRTATTFIDGLSAVAERYRGFLVDQWGVLHDGVRPYPDALECLIRLQECGKRVIILSNSGRSGAANERILASLGFPRDLYECVVSDGHGLDQGARPRDADFLLLMSMEPPHQSLTGWLPLLEASLAAGLPMICGNPDVQRTRGDGTLQEAPGFVAKAYAGMGGVVRYHGKPEPRIYQSCLSRLGLAPSEVLCIGDSLAHDVAGSQGVGLQSAFIDLAWQTTDKVDPHFCLALFDRHEMHPEFALGHLRW